MSGMFLLSVFAVSAFVACYVVLALHEVHMFQLNSYKPDVQLKWLRLNRGGYLLRRVLVIPVLLLSLAGPLVANLAAVFLYAAQAYADRPRKAKKPLVFTPRVRRMLATHAVLLALVAAASPGMGSVGRVLFPALFMFLSPLVGLLADFLNSPLERAINRRYVNDARRRLADAKNSGLIVVGVTGSFGKTSTKYFLHRLLSARYDVLMTPESYNTTLGVVRTIREELRPTHRVFVCEMGARNPGDIREICDLVRPRYGVITAIGPQHLESFRTMEKVAATKFELADAVPEDGAVFLNFDNAYIRDKAPRPDGHQGKRVVSYSVSFEGSDYRARDIRVSSSGSSFRVVLSNGEDRLFETRLLGEHNVQNLVAAIAVADFLGVPADDIAMAARRLEPVPHRLQLIRRKNVIIIDDAYNSNESGAKAALDVLAMFDGVRILVTPGMVELGEMEDECNRRFGRQAAEVCDFVVPVGAKRTESLREGLKDAGFPQEKIRTAETLEQALAEVERIDSAGKEKVVLLENDLPDNY